LIGAGAGAGGVVVAAWKVGQATKQSNAVADGALTVNEKLAAIKVQGLAASQAVAAIEGSLRHAERMPRFPAKLASWGTGSTDFRLNVWLDSTEAVSRMRVVVREARNNDGPIGFKRSLRGVPNELPPGPVISVIPCQRHYGVFLPCTVPAGPGRA
jgi:hypothetical protein